MSAEADLDAAIERIQSEHGQLSEREKDIVSHLITWCIDDLGVSTEDLPDMLDPTSVEFIREVLE